MPQKKITTKKSVKGKGSKFALLIRPWKVFWGRGWWQKLLLVITSFVLLTTSGMYGIARWYIAKHANEPLKVGATFIPQYARYFGLDPQETMQAMIDELGMRHFRLVSYWDDIEPTPGVYNFDELDWQFQKVKAVNGEVSLAIGLRQPRWPECHMPVWAANMSKDEWYPHLKTFMAKVMERYGNHPNLKSYQLENEFFMTVFGICPDHSRDRLVDEYKFVKEHDGDTPVIVSRSNNWVGIPVGEPQADQYAVSVYKRVWDKTFTKRYFEYPLPAWFYASLAGAGEIATGKDMIIHELQAESWLPEGFNMLTAPIEEQNKSMNAERLKDRLEYGRATGMRTIYAWGVEWWYWRKVHLNDPSLWDVAKETIPAMNVQ